MVSNQSERECAAAQEARRALDVAFGQVRGTPGTASCVEPDRAAAVYAILARQSSPKAPVQAPSPTGAAPPPNVARPDPNRSHQTGTVNSSLRSKGETADVSLL